MPDEKSISEIIKNLPPLELGEPAPQIFRPRPLPDTLTKVLSEPGTVEAILQMRNGTHGDYTENARISQAIKFVMESEVGWKKLNARQAESLHMIALKISRILSGNPHIKDHWDDIAGYAKLAGEGM